MCGCRGVQEVPISGIRLGLFEREARPSAPTQYENSFTNSTVADSSVPKSYTVQPVNVNIVGKGIRPVATVIPGSGVPGTSAETSSPTTESPVAEPAKKSSLPWLLAGGAIAAFLAFRQS